MLEGVIHQPAIVVLNGPNIDFCDFTLVAAISHFILMNMAD
jgi:hypothetical protein